MLLSTSPPRRLATLGTRPAPPFVTLNTAKVRLERDLLAAALRLKFYLSSAAASGRMLSASYGDAAWLLSGDGDADHDDDAGEQQADHDGSGASAGGMGMRRAAGDRVADFRLTLASDYHRGLSEVALSALSAGGDGLKIYCRRFEIHPVDVAITYRGLDHDEGIEGSAEQLHAHHAGGAGHSPPHGARGSHGHSPHGGTPLGGGGAGAAHGKKASSQPAPAGSDARSGGAADDGGGRQQQGILASIPPLEDAHLKLNAVKIDHIFGTRSHLVSILSKHYTRAVVGQLAKLIGSIDVIGNPVGLLSNLGTGVYDLFWDPIEGVQSAASLTGAVSAGVTGVAKGSASLIDGTLTTATKATGQVGKVVAAASFDSAYQRAHARQRLRTVENVGDGLMQGTKELGQGLFDGVTGIFLSPYEEAQRGGALGFVKGLGKGVVGAAVKPTVGVIDFATRATEVRSRVHGIAEGRGRLALLPRATDRHLMLLAGLFVPLWLAKLPACCHPPPSKVDEYLDAPPRFLCRACAPAYGQERSRLPRRSG